MVAAAMSPPRHGDDLAGQRLVDLPAIMSAHTRKQPKGKRAMLRLGHGASKPNALRGRDPKPRARATPGLTAALCLGRRLLDRSSRGRFAARGRAPPQRTLAGAG